MPPALAELRASHPDTDVAMRVVEEVRGPDALRRGELDVAMVLDSELMPLELPAGIEAVQCSTTRCSSRCPTATRSRPAAAISLADLRNDERMVCGVGGTCVDSNVVLRALRRGPLRAPDHLRDRGLQRDHGDGRLGHGGAPIPSLALVSAREDIAIRPLRDARPVRRVRAAVAIDRPSALADAPLEVLRQAGRERPWAGRQLAVAAA